MSVFFTCASAGSQTSEAGGIGGSTALSAQFCANGKPQTVQQRDRVLQFAAVVRQALRESGEQVALIARSGLDLSRFKLRYSHSGVLLASDGDVPWSVRQLYYDCELGRPRLFDQGLAGFVLSADAPDLAYVSIVFLPMAPGDALQATAVDRARFAPLLAAQYSANAYPFSVRYQNCNQWVAELLATAWGPPQALSATQPAALRGRAQAWLQQTGYAPRPITVDSHLTKLAAGFVPLVHLDDHPRDTQLGLVFQTSLPTDIEAWVHARWPGARRLEFCHDTEQIVVREGWRAIGESCSPEAGDRVQRFAQ
ncbi:DUF2145 domain-containing protein [Ottowia oryzae]|uniref:DUF2145 domain-containing protein n=1 Tax=Ottowia oryzae TaxID=2109914 RepID=A0A2S0MJI5_9BURK|nr:DUF2145 domain-containing protein [Ottowia oryzae]